jgi:hypothetical protein
MTPHAGVELEGEELRSDLRLASSAHSLFYRLQNSPVIRRVGEPVRFDPALVPLLVDRAEEIYAAPVPAGYVSGEDLTLAAYLFVLSSSSHAGAQALLLRVQSPRPGYRMAPRVAQLLADTSPALAANQLP